MIHNYPINIKKIRNHEPASVFSILKLYILSYHFYISYITFCIFILRGKICMLDWWAIWSSAWICIDRFVFLGSSFEAVDCAGSEIKWYQYKRINTFYYSHNPCKKTATFSCLIIHLQHASAGQLLSSL